MPEGKSRPARKSSRTRKAAPPLARVNRPRRIAAPTPLLAVDIGNSETVVGRFLGSELDGFWRLTSGRSTQDELRLALEMLVHTSAVGWGSILCSVVPSLTRPWSEALRAVTGKRPLEVSAATACIPVHVTDPDSVGADRLANAYAARKLYGAPAIVVDLGTATTLDCVSKGGAYVGGAIAPGVVTASEELFRRAAKLARVDLRRPERALGRTTEECLRVGVLWGNAGLVDSLVRRVRAELGGHPKVIATGGLAPILAPECETVDLVDEGLTLKGLRLLWEELS
ncbi:MAG: type III pantothenate kinase [Candidatus Eisenbacteria bacterium]|nr:type III pantothenate kinase [Candidatus Eisenbacteria bacterium]